MDLPIRDDLDAFLTEKMPGFVPRLAQQQMTQLVAKAIETKENALIEAGTGTGKTYAYLLPALSSGKKVIVSTGTKNLQDQLYQSDVPFMNEAFGRSTALLKGRANYLCLERLNKQISQTSSQSSDSHFEKLVTVYQWSEHSSSGDLTEILDEDDLSQVQSLITSTADNCLGQECDYFVKCPLYRARRQALEADVVIVNHHLLFADVALKEDDLGELLPNVEIIILDEAHQVEAVARNFYGEHLSSGQIRDLTFDVIREQKLLGQDDPLLIASSEHLATELRILVQRIVERQYMSIGQLDRLATEVENIDIALGELISRLSLASQRSVGMGRCYSRACMLSDMFALLTTQVRTDESAHWIEVREKSFTIHMTPLDVGAHLHPLLADQEKVWLFVSATLTTTAQHLDADTSSTELKPFQFIKNALGFDEGLIARFASPFDFEEQVQGFVPSNLPNPGDKNHTAQLMASIFPLIRTHNGRSLLLFTSHSAMSNAAACLQAEHDLAFMVQGALSKPKLIAKFRQTENAILLATHSFWEGVDLSGSNLRLLVIDKLPFTSPDNPIFQARLDRIDKSGGNGFMELTLPSAAVTLKQGFGRLIRKESDRGLFVLGDHRFVQKPYGRVLQKSLPKINWLKDSSAAIQYLETLS